MPICSAGTSVKAMPAGESKDALAGVEMNISVGDPFQVSRMDKLPCKKLRVSLATSQPTLSP